MHRSIVRIILPVLVVVAALCAPTSAVAADRVIGGEKVSDADFARYQSIVSVQFQLPEGLPAAARASLSDHVTHVCGGVLVSPRLVVTAAHCMSSGGLFFGTTGWEVLAGTNELAGTRTTAGRVKVQDVIIHPEFDAGISYGWATPTSHTLFGPRSASGHDVAVLRLERPITGVTPTPLVAPGEDVATWGGGAGRATGAVTLGWGRTAASSCCFSALAARRTVSTPLRSVELPIRSDRRCERSDGGLELSAGDFRADTMLCAGVADGPGTTDTARAACHGDSGGPLYAPAADGTQRVVGITSWASGTPTCTGWTVFSRIAGLRDWLATIDEDSGGAEGLTAPTNVTSTPVGVNSVRVAWTPGGGTPAERYFVQRQVRLDSLAPFFAPFALGELYVQGGIADAGDPSIVVEKLEPRRPGQTERRMVRVDARDAAGNHVQGTPVAVLAPIDSGRPSAPSRPDFIPSRGRGAAYLRFRGSWDADCVARYRIEVQDATGRWRGATSDAAGFGCELAEFIRRVGDDGRPRLTTQLMAIRGVAAGSWRARVVAIDRAGNTAASRPVRIQVERRIPQLRRRGGSCFGFGGTVLCVATAASTGSPVDVVVG